MRCPRLSELPLPPPGKNGWPWTVESQSLPAFLKDGREWPRISIVTPSYNQAHFLEETLRSVLLQGYPNLEYMVIDGGSSDGSVEIIRKYGQYLSLWVSEPDAGQANAISKGFRHATGDALAWLNSDDFYVQNALKRVGLFFGANPEVDVLLGSFAWADVNGRITHCFQPPVPKPWFMRRGKCYFGQQSTFIRSPAYRRSGGVDESLHFLMDLELLLRLIIRHGASASTTHDLLGCFRWHDSMKSIRRQGRKAEEIQLVTDTYMDRGSVIDRFVANWMFRILQLVSGRYLGAYLNTRSVQDSRKYAHVENT